MHSVLSCFPNEDTIAGVIRLDNLLLVLFENKRLHAHKDMQCASPDASE